MDQYADSTIAMTLYNVISKTTGDISEPKMMLAIIKEHAHPSLSLQQLRRVIKRMVRNGILIQRGNVYTPCDIKRRIIVQRDQTDVYTDDHGRIRGGWNGWMLMSGEGGLLPLETRPPKPNKFKKSEVKK